MAEHDFLKGFYQALADRPLEPDEAFYVDLYPDPGTDPVEQLVTGIEWSNNESTHLFTGFRGTGKSTELRRLRRRLQRSGPYKVVLCDEFDVDRVALLLDVLESEDRRELAAVSERLELVARERLTGLLVGVNVVEQAQLGRRLDEEVLVHLRTHTQSKRENSKVSRIRMQTSTVS